MNETAPVFAPAAPTLLYRLLSMAQGQLTRMEMELQTVGLSPTLYETLAQLDRATRPLNLRELAEGQRCAPSNITQKMDRLERDGLVRRISDPSDRRAVLAEITPGGRERTAAGRMLVQRIAAEFQETIPVADRATFARTLEAMT